MSKTYYVVDAGCGKTRTFDNFPDARRFIEHTYDYSMSAYGFQKLIQYRTIDDESTNTVSSNDVDFIPDNPKFTDYYRDVDHGMTGIMFIYWFLVLIWFAYMCIFIYNMFTVWVSTKDFFGFAIWELDRIGWTQFYLFVHTILFGFSIQVAPAKNVGKIGHWINKLVIHVPESIVALFLVIIGIGLVSGCCGVIDTSGFSLGFIPVAPIVCLGLFIGAACILAIGHTITILFIFFAEPLLYIAYIAYALKKTLNRKPLNTF